MVSGTGWFLVLFNPGSIMQAYGESFARAYNLKWSTYANQVAPSILNFYESTSNAPTNKSVLDVCCGAGHLAVHFLSKGYRVVGIDLSAPMLKYARTSASQYLESGQAYFVQADAGDFALDERFGLAVSTYDSLNHLEDEQALINCFRCVHAVADGYFIFDLNTRRGLSRWNNIYVDESSEDALIITRGNFDVNNRRAWVRFTGFTRTPNGLFQKFEESVYNTAFDMEWVKKALLEVGWKNVYFARIQDLSKPLAEPEEEGRVFIVANK